MTRGDDGGGRSTAPPPSAAPSRGFDRPRTDGPRVPSTPERAEPTPRPRTPGNYEHRGWNYSGPRTVDRTVPESGGKGGGASGGVAASSGGSGGGGRSGDRVAAGERSLGREAPRVREATNPAAKQAGAATTPALVAPQTSGLYANGVLSGVGTASVSLDARFGSYGYHYGPIYGCAPYGYYDPFWSVPSWPFYGSWYGSCWSPYGWSYGSYCGYAYPTSSYFSFGYGSGRWSFGFGFSSYSTYAGCYYPTYRVYRYLPYYYYSTVAYYPVYSSIYVDSCPSPIYVDSSDPYVEYSDAVPASYDDYVVEAEGDVPGARPAGARLADVSSIPNVFLSSLVAEYPSGLTYEQYVDRGTRELREGRYWDAAEAFRRAWLAAPREASLAFRLGYALFGTGRVDLAAEAFRAGFALDPWAHRRTEDLRSMFGSDAAYRAARTAVERRVVAEPKDADARLTLAVVAFMSGDWFAAREQFSALGTTEASAELFKVESELRLAREDER